MELLLFLLLLLLSSFIDVSVASSPPPAANTTSPLFVASSTPLPSSPFNGSSSISSPPYRSPRYDTSSRFNPSMAIIIVVLLSAFFFMGFFSIYVRRCTAEDEFDSGPTNDLYNNSDGSGNFFFLSTAASRHLDQPPQGLDKFLVNELPMVRFSLLKERKGETECVVCLNDFQEGEELRLLPKCGHLFHQGCVDMWLFSHTTCPVCRRGLIHDKSSYADFARTAPESSRTDEGTAPESIHSSQVAEVTIDVDDPIREVAHERERHTPGAIQTSLLRVDDFGAGCSQRGSPILGVMEAPAGSYRHGRIDTGRKLSRSHSTGHFVLRRARNRLNEQFRSSFSERWDPSCSPLFLAMANIRRTRSYTLLSDLQSTPQEEQQIGTDGCSLSFHRHERGASVDNGWCCSLEPLGSRGANSERSSSPSSSVRRTLRRLTGVQKSTHLLHDMQREFTQLAYVL